MRKIANKKTGIQGKSYLATSAALKPIPYSTSNGKRYMTTLEMLQQIDTEHAVIAYVKALTTL